MGIIIDHINSPHGERLFLMLMYREASFSLICLCEMIYFNKFVGQK